MRSGIAGAGGEPHAAVHASASCANARHVGAPGEVRVDGRRRRVRGPRRRAGPRSPDGSACRSYEVVAAEDRRGSPSIVGRRGRAHAAVPRRARRRPHRAPPRDARPSQADVWRLAYHLVGPDDADDVTQDTFVRAWKALPDVPGRLERPHLAALDRPPGLRRRRCGATCAAGGCSSAAGAPGRRGADRPATVDPSDAHAVVGAGRRAARRPARRLRAHPGRSAAPTQRRRRRAGSRSAPSGRAWPGRREHLVGTLRAGRRPGDPSRPPARCSPSPSPSAILVVTAAPGRRARVGRPAADELRDRAAVA